ncbi:MAG: patatin-like protein [Sphingomonadaceae bacterium]
MREKELRLALVCYGGISLAVYMHGITKEIWHLARASRAFHDALAPATPVEAAWHAVFEAAAKASGLKLRVLPDIIAGASAGGINGIFLAQAIATGQSLEPLTELWLADADADALLDPQAKMPSRFSKIWAMPLVWAFANRQEAVFADELDAEAQDKLQRFMRSRWFEPPFGGPGFDRMLLRAFDAMAASGLGPRLLPDDQPLDLFVTVTEFHGHPERLRLNSPPEISETEHRLTLTFRDAPGDPQAIGHPNDLVFAARATASFPGAFPPFTVAELDAVLHEDGRDWPGREEFLARIMPSRAAENAVLIDGSVLANAPFRPAIDALRNRPARREVDRRFVYIDPKPGHRSVGRNRKDAAEIPGFFKTILGALSDLPREQPIRDNLEAIEGRSSRIRRTRAIIESIRPAVEASVQALFGRTFLLDRPNPARLATWRLRAEARAARDAGHSFLAYAHLRATALEPRRPDPGETLAAFLSRCDLRYRIRRLRFMSRQIALLDDTHPDQDFSGLRAAIYACLGRLLEIDMGAQGPDDLADLDAATDRVIADALALLSRPMRRMPLLAWLGFPFYDVATYLLSQGEGFDEFETIKVDRIAPEDAQSIRQGPSGATLKGVRFNSFGAFFSRAYRENDYLWGRLHGAERLIDILASTLPTGSALPADIIGGLKRTLFAAILDEEALRCTSIAPLIAELRAEIAAMGGKGAATSLS